MSHSPTTCPICLASRPAREAAPQELTDHFQAFGFCPTVKNSTPGAWVWSWLRGDSQVWSVATAPRASIENRLKQIEALAWVNDLVQDPLACLLLDMGWRNWEEGLPRVVALRFSQDWILGDELPEPKVVKQVSQLLKSATPSEALGMASALYARLYHAVPPSCSDDWFEPLMQAWSWLPVLAEKDQWVFSGTSDTRRYQISLWKLKAEKIIPNAQRFLNAEHRQALLPWWTAVVSPSICVSSEIVHKPTPRHQDASQLQAFKIEGWLDEDLLPSWPENDPHLPFFYEKMQATSCPNPKALQVIMDEALLKKDRSGLSKKPSSIYRL